MKINRNNYEIYMVDYLDGQLSKDDEQDLMQFLEKNPDLKEELDLIQNTSLPDAEVVFDGKDVLKKNLEEEVISDDNIDEWCIASIENDLTKQGQLKFARALESQPAFKNTFTAYLKTKLEAENIPFPGTKPWKLPHFDNQPDIDDTDYWIIAALENDLTLAQRKEWNAFKKQIPGIEKIEQQYQLTRLKAEQVHYPEKQKLKKRSSRMRYLYPLSGVAAAAALFYLFISIANINENTYKTYNEKMAKIEQQSQDGVYPSPAFFNPTLKKHMMNTIAHFSSQQKEQKQNQTIIVEKTSERQFANLDPVPIRKANLEQSGNPTIQAPKIKTQVISADKLMNKMYAQNSQSAINVQEENKLTFFKAAQKGVKVVNNKIGTKMDLEARYDDRGQKKRVKFSTRLFSVTRTVNQ